MSAFLRRTSALVVLPALLAGSCERAAPAQGAEEQLPDTLSRVREAPRFYDFDVTALTPRYAEKLERGSADALRLALEQLAAAGDAAVPEILRILDRALGSEAYFAAVSNACEALAATKTGRPDAVEGLRRALRHPSGTARTAAAKALGVLRPADAFGALRDAFERAEPAEKVLLLRAIGELEGSESDAYLASLAVDPRQSDLARRAAIELLAARPIAGAEPHLRKLRAAPEALGEVATLGLVRARDPGAIARARELAADPALPGSALAVALLAGIGEIEPALTDLKHADPAVRERVALPAFRDAIEKNDLSPESRAQVVEALGGRAGDPAHAVRVEAFRLLVLLGVPPPAEKDLEDLASEDPERVSRALEVVTDPRIADRRATPILIRKLRAAPPSRQQGFLQALGRLRDPAAVPVIAERLSGPASNLEGIPLADYAALQLANLGEPGVAAITAALRTERSPVRRAAFVRALTGVRGSARAAALATLHAIAEDSKENPEVRAIALRALPRLEGNAAAAFLKRLLPIESDAGVRRLINALLFEYY